ncbi:hypothetical protein PAP_02320 [Palaeococcus pacificus DY20341]|uniref:DUF2240 family protein n=1 Tax=Palaeococcus pacificus DY20341 TaxID=1343739 RepID=A0A075LRD7_9EURY|nr:DUF2240 family protein [Palaeococcus pacificus]AIF68894.1 hypothetical protein PAP_02320 [Palaeococcus pacificus DY20341]
MESLKQAVALKGSNEFGRQELVAILSFKLGLMAPKEAKELISSAIEDGIIEVRDDTLVVHLERAEEKKRDVFKEMVTYIAEALGWDKEEVLEEINVFAERYGNLDKKLVAYLYGIDKGLDMSVFKDMIE